jgi:aldehyde:ferredoxin oxidoreductase
MLEPVPSGPAAGRELGKFLPRMLDEYYALLDWDLQTGKPSDRVLQKVGLQDYVIGRRAAQGQAAAELAAG